MNSPHPSSSSNVQSSEIEIINTGREHEYQDVPNLNLSTQTMIQFSVKARNDAHVLLTTENDELFEIVIGGWNNTNSTIRRAKQIPGIVDYPGAVVSEAEHKRFALDWSTPGVLKLYSKEDSESPPTQLMKTAQLSQSMLDIKRMAVATGWESTGEWKIQVAGQNKWNIDTIITGYSYDYQTVPNLDLSTRKKIQFTVKARTDAHVLLTTKNNDIFEIVIGGWSNTSSTIRKAKQAEGIVSHQGAVVSETEHKRFELDWSTQGVLGLYSNAGDGSPPTELMKTPEQSQSMLEIKSMAVTTGFGSAGEWKIQFEDHD